MGYGAVAVGSTPVVHLLEYLIIHIKPATPNLLALGVVHFGSALPLWDCFDLGHCPDFLYTM